jgi:hypothetical protein
VCVLVTDLQTYWSSANPDLLAASPVYADLPPTPVYAELASSQVCAEVPSASTRVAGTAKMKSRSSSTSQIIELQDKTLEAVLQLAGVERERLEVEKARLQVEREMCEMKKLKLLAMGFVRGEDGSWGVNIVGSNCEE